MAGRVAYYGNIVKDGLIFAIDAAKEDSYPKTGASWYDISGYGNNGTLTNGPTFSTLQNGFIQFNGVNNNISFSGNTFNYSPGTTGNLSLELFVYPTGPFVTYINEPPITNLGGLIGQGYLGPNTGWGIGVIQESSIYKFTFQVRNNLTITQQTSSFTLNNWYHVIGTFDRNSLSNLYVNSALVTSGSLTSLSGLTLTPSINNAAISVQNTFYSGCRISSARIYNRALSSTEILQNYNALRGRYGL